MKGRFAGQHRPSAMCCTTDGLLIGLEEMEDVRDNDSVGG